MIATELSTSLSSMTLDTAKTILLKHSKSKLNGIFPEKVSHSYHLTNPICGDHVELKCHVQTSENELKIDQIGFQAKACAICTASASLLCEEAKNKSVASLIQLSRTFEQSILSAEETPWPSELAGLSCFQHLRINPSRRACALLPWITIRSLFK